MGKRKSNQQTPFPKTELIKQALEKMPERYPRDALCIHLWLCNDGRELVPKGIDLSLDDVEQLLDIIQRER